MLVFFQMEFATSKGRWEGAESSISSFTHAFPSRSDSLWNCSPRLNYFATTLASTMYDSTILSSLLDSPERIEPWLDAIQKPL